MKIRLVALFFSFFCVSDKNTLALVFDVHHDFCLSVGSSSVQIISVISSAHFPTASAEFNLFTISKSSLLGCRHDSAVRCVRYVRRELRRRKTTASFIVHGLARANTSYTTDASQQLSKLLRFTWKRSG